MTGGKEIVTENNKSFLTLRDYSGSRIKDIINLAAKFKKNKNYCNKILAGKNIAMLFDKHSTRTRLSFEAGISQLGGNCIYLDSSALQIKRGETIKDSAIVFGRYLDGIIIRTFLHETVETFAQYSGIPVINGLTDLYHPCQIISDLFTISETGLLKKSLKFTYVGDCNNVLNSLLIGFSKIGLNITVGCSEKYPPEKEILGYAIDEAGLSGSAVSLVHDPFEAVTGADIVYTDVWVSMGDEESEEKIKALEMFQVNNNLLSHAKPGVKVMHCLPAHRGQEITSEVLDGKNSIVWQQAENRLHAQKAMLAYLYR